MGITINKIQQFSSLNMSGEIIQITKRLNSTEYSNISKGSMQRRVLELLCLYNYKKKFMEDREALQGVRRVGSGSARIGEWGGKGLEEQDLNTAGAVTATPASCCEDLWLFSFKH